MNRKVQKISAVLCASVMILTGCSQVQFNVNEQSSTKEEADEQHIYEIEKKTVTVHESWDDEPDEIELVFLDGVTDVPYVSVESFKDLFGSMMASPQSPDLALTMEEDGECVTLKRESGYPVKIAFDENYIYFWDLDAFFRMTEDVVLMDNLDSMYFDEDGGLRYLEVTDSFERYGRDVTVDAGHYGIDLVHQDDGYYIPLQLVSDVFFSPYGVGIIYNGSDVYFGVGGNFADFKDLFYNKDYPEKRSPELAEFNYNELCLALDFIYGLKDQHDITEFNTMFMQTGLMDKMHSEDRSEACQALYESINVYLDDLHSGFLKNIYVKNDVITNKNPRSAMIAERDEERHKEARAEYYGEDVPGYEEVGNTAYISFDEFTYQAVDYYNEKAEDHLDDTMGLAIYSFEQITRKDSPIENVVLDMSVNHGGVVFAAAYIIGMFIGDGSLSVRNATSDALVTQNFKADLNLDRKFDDSDTLLGKYNLICLTSPVSFSCGNLVPSVLKNSHEVITMGQTSGGGACIVHYLTTADGSIMQLSGQRQMSYTKNGSFYEIDRGVEPDYIISVPEQFYDREALTKRINEILGM